MNGSEKSGEEVDGDIQNSESSSSSDRLENEEDGDQSDYQEEEGDDDESYETEEDDGSGRTLLFLCEEGQLDTALKRVREWDERFPIAAVAMNESSTAAAAAAERSTQSTTESSVAMASNDGGSYVAEIGIAMIRRELFRTNPASGNSCLHEILAGGTAGKSAPELVERLVRRYQSLGEPPEKIRSVFLAQPRSGSNGRTILHWCAWSRTSPRLLRLVMEACPEAMCLRDNRSHFSRTPLEIAERYWPDDEITKILKTSFRSYLRYRLRVCVRLCTQRLFLGLSEIDEEETKEIRTPTPTPLKPFDKKDRRIARVAPRPWFVASVLAYALQREMKDLALRVLSFIGCGAKLETKRRSKQKRKISLKRMSCAGRGNRSSNAGIPSEEETSRAAKKQKTR